MWALGTTMAELVNLKPMFPGSGQIDQLAKIYEVLGDPSDEYGVDVRGKSIGGGAWSKGIQMAGEMGFAFPKVCFMIYRSCNVLTYNSQINPKDIFSLFKPTTPTSLIECISDLLKYDPELRLTSQQCLQHPYFVDAANINIG
jgi:meiosis induction protein kinase IME2/SME1